MGNAQRKEKDAADKTSGKASKADKTKKDGRRTLQEEFQSGDDIQSSFETIQKDEIKGVDADGELSTAGASEAIGDSNQGKQNVMFHDLVQQLDSFSIPIKSVPPSSDSAINGQELEKLEGSSLPASSSEELSVPSPSSTARQGASAAHSLEPQKVVYDAEPEEVQAPSAQVEHGDQSGVVPMSEEAVQEGTDPVSDKSIPEPQEKQDPPIPKPHIDISEGATHNEAVQESAPKPEGEESMITENVQPRQVIQNEPAEGLKDEVDQECKEAVLINEHAAILDPAVDNRKVELAGVSVPPEEAPLPTDIITEEVSAASDGQSEAVNEKLTDSNSKLSEGPETFKEEKLQAESQKEDSQDSNSTAVVDTEDPETAADNSAVVKDQEEKSLMVEDEQHAPVFAEEKPTALPSNEMAPSGNGELDAKSSLDTAELVEDHPSDSVASADGSADSKVLDTSKDSAVEAEVQATETADETDADETSTVVTENEEPTPTVGQDTKEDTIALENAERKEQDTEEPIADSYVPEDASKQKDDASTVEETNHQTTGSVTEENVEDLNQPVAANEPPAEESTEDANAEEGTREDASGVVEINEGEEVADKAVDVFSPIEDSSKNTEEPTDLHDDSIAANDRLFPTEDKEDLIDVVEINETEAPAEDTIKDQNEPTVLEEDLQETLDDSVVVDDSMASTVEETSDHIGSITDKTAASIGAGEPNTEDSTRSDAEATKEGTIDADETGVPVEDPSKDQNEPTVLEEDPQETLDGSVVADSMVEETSRQIGSITDKAAAPRDEDPILASTGSDAEATKEETTDAVEINENEVPVEDPSKDQNEPAVVEEDPQETLDGSVVADDSMAEKTSGSITDKAAAPIGEDSILASAGSDAEATKEDTTDAVEINESGEVPVEDPSKDQHEPAVVEEHPQETLDGSVVADDSKASAVEETGDHIGSITDKAAGSDAEATKEDAISGDEDSMLASIGSDAEATKEDAIAEKESVCIANEEAPDKTSDVLATVDTNDQDTHDQDTQELVNLSGVEEASRGTHAENVAATEPVHSTVEEMNDQSTGLIEDDANVADSTSGEPTELLATEEPATATEVKNNIDDASTPTIAEEEPAAIEETSPIKAEDANGNITDDAAPKEDLEETKETATQLNEQINKDLMTGEKTSEERQNDEVVANVDVPELIEMKESVDGEESKEPGETSEVLNVDSTTEESNSNEDHEVKNKDEASLEEPRNASTIDEQVASEEVAATTEATGEEPKPSEADEIDTGAISSSAAGEDSNETVEQSEPTTTQEPFQGTKAEAGNEGPAVDSFSAEDGPIEVKGEDVPTAEDAALVPKEMNNEESPTIEDQATTKDLTNIEVENGTEKIEEPGAVEDIKRTTAANEEVTIQEAIEVLDEEVLPTAEDASLAPKEANEVHKEDQTHDEVENATEKSEEPGAVEDQESTSMENAHEDLVTAEDACGKSDDSVAINDTTENTEMNSQPAKLEDGTSATNSSQGENT